MLLRAFPTRLVLILIVGLGIGLGIGLGATSASAAVSSPATGSMPSVVVVAVVVAATPDGQPPITANPFLPEERGLGECISAVPKPGCGSEERGGWHQQLVFLALVLGLSIIGWRIVAGLRKSPPRPTATDLKPSSRE